jgi:hypothetical protein
VATIAVPRAARRVAMLPPEWPVHVLFLGFPLWWLLGARAFIWVIVAVPMTLSLVVRERVRVPRAFGVWILFLLWTLASTTQLDSLDSGLLFMYRFSLYVSATILFVFVYNLPGRELRRALFSVAGFGVFVLLGGLLGLLFPTAEIRTPMESILPGGLLANDWIHDLVHIRFAQVQTFVVNPLTRPAAPFTYTNEWGATFALLVPLSIVAVRLASPRWRRIGIALLILSGIPLIESGNRGAWLAIAAGITYAAVRKAWRGRVGTLLAIIMLAAAAAVALFTTQLGEELTQRATHPQANRTRISLYQEAAEHTARSPAFGYGAPPPSSAGANAPPVGTHGQIWLVLVSSGVPAGILFLGWFLLSFWRTRRSPTPLGFWANVTLAIGLLQFLYYEILVPEIMVLMVATAFAWHERGQPTGNGGSPVPPRELAVVTSRSP